MIEAIRRAAFDEEKYSCLHRKQRHKYRISPRFCIGLTGVLTPSLLHTGQRMW
jgi:hypothetical protein